MSKKKKAAPDAKVSAVRVKWVPRAGLWCRTVVAGGQQTQTWHDTRPE